MTLLSEYMVSQSRWLCVGHIIWFSSAEHSGPTAKVRKKRCPTQFALATIMNKAFVFVAIIATFVALVAAARVENTNADPKFTILPVDAPTESVQVQTFQDRQPIIPSEPMNVDDDESEDTDTDDEDHEGRDHDDVAPLPAPEVPQPSDSEHPRPHHPRWSDMCAQHLTAQGRRPCRWAVFWHCSRAGLVIRHTLTLIGAITVVCGIVRLLRRCCCRCRRGACRAQPALPVAAAPSAVFVAPAQYQPPVLPQLFQSKA